MRTSSPGASGTNDVSVAVVIGGGPVHSPDPDRTFDVVIAADSGLDVALAAGLVPTHLVGDLDSITVAGMLWAETNEVIVERHPTDKDATDTALALALAVALGADHLIVFGGTGIDRFDHLLGTVVALGHASLAPLRSITAHLGASTLHVLHPGHAVTLDLPHGHAFSLVPLHGRCRGVEVRHARWPLDDADLPAGSTRGISNESLGLGLHISTADGVLTVVIPRPEHPSTASVGSTQELT